MELTWAAALKVGNSSLSPLFPTTVRSSSHGTSPLLMCSNKPPSNLAKAFPNLSQIVKPITKQPLPSPITVRELLRRARISPLLISGDDSVHITGLQHDSRLVCRGDLFICCKGFSTDGHLHAAHATQQGAVAVIATRPIGLNNGHTFIQVEDTNSILSSLSAAFYGHPSEKMTVVGITGTNGKTTTSYLVKSVFEAAGQKTGLLGTIAYYTNDEKSIVASKTTPDALSLQHLMASMVRNSTDVCVMEVSSHALVLGRCNHVDFDLAVFTNLTRDHMDFHRTEQNYKEAKGLLFTKMKDPLKNTKIVNIDDPHAAYFIGKGSSKVPVIRFSLENSNADVFASKLDLSLHSTVALVHTPAGNVHITSKLLGRHNVCNILAAVAVGIAANQSLKDIGKGIQAVDSVPGRCELIWEGQNFAVIVDYAHTPDALGRLLDTIRECGARQIISVAGCGGDRDRGKRPIMAKAAAEKSNICILTSDNPRTENPLSILDEMLAGVGSSVKEYFKHDASNFPYYLDNGHRLIVCENRSMAIRRAVSMAKEGDAVVIAGKGHETYQIIGDRKEHFDDREECRRALQQLGFTATQPDGC